MSVPGTTTATIRNVIINALDGQTLAGLTYMTVKLSQSCDPLSLTSPSAAVECIDGGFVVIPGTGRTVSATTPHSTYGTVQRQWEVPFIVRWSLDLNGVALEKLSVDLYKIPAAVRRLIDAALEPPVGTSYNVTSISESAPARQAGGSILTFEVTYAIKFTFA
jgi:hypothetical protein